MAVTGRITGETRGKRQPGGHLTERSHDEEDNGTNEGVGDEERTGASVGEGSTSTDNETGSEGTTDGNHGDVTRLEAAVQRRLGRRLETTDVHVLAIVARDLSSTMATVGRADLLQVAALVAAAALDRVAAWTHGCLLCFYPVRNDAQTG